MAFYSVSSNDLLLQFSVSIQTLKAKFSIAKGINAHWKDSEDTFLASKGTSVYTYHLEGSGVRRGVLKFKSPGNLFSTSELLRRVGRKGFHFMLKPEDRDEIIGIWNNKIFLWKEKFELSTLKFRGSRPLNICFNPKEGCYYFGEYFSNDNREEVHIYRSSTGLNWSRAFTFNAGDIRHVHRVQYDAHREGMWILTGDTNEESAIYFTNDGFNTVNKIFHGSQQARAVGIIVEGKIITIPSDTPLEHNAIRELNQETKEIKDIFSLPNSAFHADTFAGEWQFVTTVAEPSEMNNEKEAFIFIRKKGGRWVNLLSGKQDVFSSLSKKYFRYPEFVPCGNLGDSNHLIFFCRGIRNLNNSTILFNLEDIINYYNAIE